MKRAIILSLGVLLSMGVVLPLTTNWSEAASGSKPAKRKKLRKYSRSWWRQYRAKQRRARLVAARRRASLESGGNAAGTRRAAPLAKSLTPVNPVPGSAFDAATPAGWSRQAVAGSVDTEFRVADSVSGQPLGTAQLSVVGAATPDEGATENARSKTLGGVPLTTLRRQVIDRMVREEGWIVNDYQREVAGRRVFVVEAQTSKGGAVSSRRFYFTEVNGRVYSLSTDSPTDFSDRLAADSEKLLTDLHQRSGDQNNRTDTATAIRP